MNAYIYQAALLCEDCGKKQQFAHLTMRNPYTCRHGIVRCKCEDSDCTPQGPYADGGGESDSPQHCDHCGVFLENPLTSDGEEYVREHCKVLIDQDDDTWREYYSYLFRDTAEEPAGV